MSPSKHDCQAPADRAVVTRKRSAVKATPRRQIKVAFSLQATDLNDSAAPGLKNPFSQAMIPAHRLPIDRPDKNSGHQGVSGLTPHHIRSNDAPTSSADGIVIA
jgi:hypothetical protein